MAAAEHCSECDGVGLVKTEGGMRLCACREAAQRLAAVRRARIPDAYTEARLDNFQSTPTTKAALVMAKRFVADFVPGQQTRGLLLTGSVGTGKTHLAVGILRDLVERMGIKGRFVDVRDLLERLKNTYDDNVRETQSGVLRPILTANLVVIDELGAPRPSDWVFETIELLIGGLYNYQVPVIVTTNLANFGVGGEMSGAVRPGNDYARVVRQETLGDRIGARMWSRLQQMCTPVDMTGPDWRGKAFKRP